MTLTQRKRIAFFVEPGQASTIASAGGTRLDGDFEWTASGWTLTVRALTFHELVAVIEAARKIVE
jgi:hypothetical protein